MRNLTVILSLALAGAVVLVFGAGCTMPWQRTVEEKVSEKAAENALEQASGGNVDVDIDNQGETSTFTTEEGETTFGVSEIPDNFPSDVPIYPDSVATFSHVGTGDGIDSDTASTSLESDDDVDKIADWYKTEITNNGWTITNTDSWGSGTDKYTSYMATKGELELSVGVSAAEKTMITIAVFPNDGSDLDDTMEIPVDDSNY